MPHRPDINTFIAHKTIEDVDLDGTVVPGLTGRFFQRQEGGQTATAGVYSYQGQELFISWGYRHEAHCAWTAYRAGENWTPPHPGCPRISVGADAVVLDTGVDKVRLPLPRQELARPGAEAG